MKLRLALGIFPRTFFALSFLLTAALLIWTQLFLQIEADANAERNAQQLGAIVNLTRAALAHANPSERAQLLENWQVQEGIHIRPKSSSDVSEVFRNTLLIERTERALKNRLGSETFIATRVNSVNGLWISFRTRDEEFWLQANPNRIAEIGQASWLISVTLIALISLIGAALMAARINKPFAAILSATKHMLRGDFEKVRLQVSDRTPEVREVNRAISQMSFQLARLDEDRKLILAGLSHDIRSPLARLRLEVEMGTLTEVTKADMTHDIEQMDNLVKRFIDYAKDRPLAIEKINFPTFVVAYAQRWRNNVNVVLRYSDAFKAAENFFEFDVLADASELGRVMGNVIQNAISYGKTPNSQQCVLLFDIRRRGNTVAIAISDHGVGVKSEHLALLTRPFFRADAARTASEEGSGLGLAISLRIMQQMGGNLTLRKAATGGLRVKLTLPHKAAKE